VYIHGEKEAIRREEAVAKGVQLDNATFEMLEEFAGEFGLTPPKKI